MSKKKRMELFGIEHISPANPQNAYTSRPLKGSSNTQVSNAQQKALEIANATLKEKGSLEKLLPLNLGNQSGMHETTEAARRIVEEGRDMLVYDIETFGTPKHNRIGRSADTNHFSIAQLSLMRQSGLDTAGGNPDVLAIGLDADMRDFLTSKISELETNPRAINTWSEDTRRSVADLGLYQDSSHFGRRTIAGQDVAVLLGQSESINYKGTAMASSENIASYKKGLANITNPKLTNNRETVYSVINHYGANNPVPSGHNVIGFDKPALLDWIGKDQGSGAQRARQLFSQAHVDSLPLSRSSVNQDAFQTDTFQLSDLHNALTGKRMHAHFAGDDVIMNAEVLTKQLQGVREGKVKLNSSTTVQQNELFFAEKGTGRFYESEFNRNRGEYDITLRYDKDNKQFVRSRGFQEPALIAGDEYKFIGSMGKQEIGGVQHNGIIFQDVTNDTYKFMFRQSEDGMADIFNTNLVKTNTVDRTRRDYIKDDSARRFMDSLFDTRPQSESDTVTKRLDYAYNVIGRYDTHLSKLTEEAGTPAPGNITKTKDRLHEQAIRAVEQDLNAGKSVDDIYQYSRSKIRKIVHIKDALQENSSLLDQVKIDSAGVMGAGESGTWANAHRVNQFYQPFYEQIKEQAGEMDYAHKGMRFMRIPERSLEGKPTYLNVTSKSDIESRFRSTLRVGDGKGKGAALNDFEHLLSSLGPLVDEKTKMEWRKKANSDLTKSGRVMPGTISHMTSVAHRAANEATVDGNHIVSRIPGFNIRGARPDGTGGSDLYANNLTTKENPLYKELKERATIHSYQNLHTSASIDMVNFNIAALSDPAKQKITRTQEITSFMEENARATSAMIGLNGQPKQDIMSKVNHSEQIQKTVNFYKNKGYDVSLDYLEDADQMYLSFSHKDSYQKVSNLTSAERIFGDSVNSIALPMANSDASVPIGGQNVKQNYSLMKDKNTGGWKIKSTTESLYEGIQNLPSQIDSIMKTHANEGNPISRSEAEKIAIRRQQARARDGGIMAKFYNAKRDERGTTPSSRERNLTSMVDMNAYYEDYTKRNMPDVYEKFDSWRRQPGNEYASFSDRGWGEMGIGQANTMAKVRMGAYFEWNDTIGKETGFQINPYGLNEKQWSSGMMNLVDPTTTSLMGQWNPASREQILKTQNYKALERGPLEAYYGRRFGSNIEATDRIFESVQSQELSVFENIAGPEDGIATLNSRQIYTNDKEVHDVAQMVKKDIQTELDQLQSKVASGDDSLETKIDIAELTKDLEQLNTNKASVFEEQIIGRESLLNNMFISDQVRVTLDENKELNNQITRLVEAELDGGEMTPGAMIKFRKQISYKDMQDKSLGIVDKDGFLTVGKLITSAYEEGDVGSSVPSQRQRLHPESFLEGIEVTPEGVQLMLTNRRHLRDGDKLIGGIGGDRNTVVGLRDNVMDRMVTYLGGHKDTDFIGEHIKTSRYPAGAMMGTIMTTSYHNALEDFDRVFAGEDAKLGLTSAWANKKGLLSGDYDAERKSFLEEVFLPQMSEAGVGEFLGFNDKGQMAFKSRELETNLTGVRGAKAYNKLYSMASSTEKGFGFSHKSAIVPRRAHNVDRWARAGHAPGLSMREMNLLNQSFTNLDEMEGMLGEDTAIMQHMRRITTASTDTSHLDYAKGVQHVIDSMSGDGTIESAQQAGNVIFDLTGKYSYATGENVKRITKDGTELFVVDGLSITQAPVDYNRTNADVRGTSADLMSVVLQSDDADLNQITVGDLVVNSGGKAFMQIQDPTNDYYKGRIFSRDVVPVAPNFLGTPLENDAYRQKEIEKSTERVFNQAQRFAGVNFSGSNLTAMEQAQHLTRIAASANDSMSDLTLNALNYATSSSDGSFMKATRSIRNFSGASGIAGGKNIFSEGEYDVGEVFVSGKYADALIEGNEWNILEANNIARNQFESAEEARDYIKGKIQGTRGDDDPFQMFSFVNRYPTQSEGSVVPVNLRVDSSMGDDDGRTILSRGVSNLLGADYDGDNVFLSSYFYNSHEDTDFRAVQSDLNRVHGRFRQRAISSLDPVGGEVQEEAFSAIANLSGEKQKEFFQSFRGDGAAMQQFMANEMKSPGIGAIDNTMVAARDMMRYTLGAGVEGGSITPSQYQETMSEWDEVNNLLVQNFISAKKIDQNELAGGRFTEFSRAEQMDYALAFIGNQNQIPQSIRQIKPETVGSIMTQLHETGAVADENQEALIESSLTKLAQSNQALIDSGLGGMENPAFFLGRSNVSEYRGNQIISTVQESPASLVGTENMSRFVSDYFGSDSDQALTFKESQKSVRQQVAQSLSSTFGRPADTSMQDISSAASEQLDMMTGLVSESMAGKKANTEASIMGQLANITRDVAGSDSFKMGAGFAAMWMVSSAVKRGPTPEGNEAQQEGGMASPEEVDPSRLLSGPTARITPQSEQIRMQISGTGNVDNDMIAGIVNNTVNSMTGASMQMHLDVTDNTQKLDRKFYQQTVNNALGF